MNPREVLSISASTEISLPGDPAFKEKAHLITSDEIRAVNAAILSGRPLLCRGKPGVGKSQLAEAIAEVRKQPFLRFVVDGRTEPRDLLYEVDHVERLARAQTYGVGRVVDADAIRSDLALHHFVRPGCLWWALDWAGARAIDPQREPSVSADRAFTHGAVLLIDEIDKAESDVPNGLLEVLGDLSFRDPEGKTIKLENPAPLVFITTNEERDLPDAFVRRCVVLHLAFPKKQDEFVRYMADRGAAQFRKSIGRDVLEEAARQIFDDRRGPDDQQKPGLAEFLDMMRMLAAAHPGNPVEQRRLLEESRRFIFQKFSDIPENDRRGE